MPFYVNRSKRALDKAGGFCAQLAARLTHLAAEAGAAAGAHATSATGAGSEEYVRACPELEATLVGWRLEVMLRVQQPQNELHVCVKMTHHADLIAPAAPAAAAAAAAAATAAADPASTAAAPPADAAAAAAATAGAAAAAADEGVDDDEMWALPAAVAGCMAQVARVASAAAARSPSPSMIGVFVNHASARAAAAAARFAFDSASTAAAAADAAAADATAGAPASAATTASVAAFVDAVAAFPSAVVTAERLAAGPARAYEVSEFSQGSVNSHAAVLCDAAVEWRGSAGREGWLESVVHGSARALALGGCLALLVPAEAAGVVHRSIKAGFGEPNEQRGGGVDGGDGGDGGGGGTGGSGGGKEKQEEGAQKAAGPAATAAGEAAAAAGEVWSAHSTYRANLATGVRGMKDIAVVLFKLERGAAKAPLQELNVGAQ